MLQDPIPAREAVQTEEHFLFLNLPETWVLGLLVLPAVILFARWSYGGLTRLEPRTRVTLAALRGLAIAFGLFLLFQPAFERVRYTEVQSQIHVLVDDSASMQRRDTYPDEAQRRSLELAAGVSDLAAETRAQLVRKVLEKPGGLCEQLRKTFDVRLFRFVRKPLPVRDLGELTSRGPRTQIGDALELHLAAAGSVNLDALILVSDGRNNAGQSPVEVAAKYRLADTAIYTIGVGDPNPPRNIRLIGPPGPKDALRLEEVVFETTLDAEGLEGRPVTVTMHGARDGGPELVMASQAAVLAGDHQPVKVRLYHAFEDSGDYTLRFVVTSLPEETSHDDNQEIRFLRVNDEKIRVLFVDDLPRWEYRYVKNALKRVDPSIEVQVFLFDASLSFEQEHSDGLPPLRTLPRSLEELLKFHVILLGDVPPERIGATEDEVFQWLEHLVEFVEFGGGIGISFGDRAMPDRYRGTPLEDLLPVVLEDPVELRHMQPDRSRSFAPQLEDPAQPHDIVLLKREPENNRRLWQEGFQQLYVYYPVQQAKAGATVLLRHPTEANRYGKRVLAATSYFPRGHTFFVATDETWRWRDPYGEKYYDSFWRNVVRHLASGRLKRRDDRVELRVDKVTIETGGQVRVGLTVRDVEYQPTVVEEYPVFLRGADRAPERRTLRPVPGEVGSYQGTFTMEESGSFSFLVFENDNPQGKVLAREDVFVKIPDREMADSSQDRESLEKIAAASKDGRYVFLADAQSLMTELGDRRPFETEVDRSTRPIWDNLWTLLGLLVVLGAEWILRKRARLV
jgi:hypothetical protein